MILAVLSLFLAFEASAETEVDLELVLAVDASGSVDDREFDLQMTGIARAFRHPDVLAAIGEGPLGRIAVVVEVWAEARLPKDSSNWFVVHDAESAEQFAQTVENFPRTPIGGTGIGRAIIAAVNLFDRNEFFAWRRVIDISGDGKETTTRDWSIVPELARIQAVKRGITINGLAILSDDPNLAAYYIENVIIGTDAFVMEAATFEDFSLAIRRKLIREINQRPQLSHHN